jgi:DNA-binding SARP family transcriptional activator
MNSGSESRIQVCGPLVLRLDGHRRESELHGRQGREIAAYLIVNRTRTLPRDELMEALWHDDLPEAAEETLTALISRTRRVFGSERLIGRSELRLVLPPDASVDLEVASWAAHRAESAVAQQAWRRAWVPARAALNVANRGFLPGYEAPWIDERRREVESIRLRALEAIAAVGLGLGGTELASTERAARALVAAAPYRETGYRLLMEYLAARGDVAEALRVYEELRTLLRDALGIAPSDAVKELHSRLLVRT